MANKWVNLTAMERGMIEVALSDFPTGMPSIRNSIIKKIKKADKTITVSSRKGKGRDLQQFACREISDLIGVPFDNKDDSCLIHSREMGQAGVDVILRGEAQEKFPFSVECKSGESISLRNFVLQARNNKKEGTDWLLLIRTKSIPEDIVVISWDTFKKLFRKGVER